MSEEIRPFKIYYSGGKTYSNEDGDPFHAPGVDVQVIMQDGGIQSGSTAYYWKEGVGWNACDAPGMYDYLMNHMGPQKTIFGRTIRDKEFWETRRRAKDEREQAKV